MTLKTITAHGVPVAQDYHFSLFSWIEFVSASPYYCNYIQTISSYTPVLRLSFCSMWTYTKADNMQSQYQSSCATSCAGKQKRPLEWNVHYVTCYS